MVFLEFFFFPPNVLLIIKVHGQTRLQSFTFVFNKCGLNEAEKIRRHWKLKELVLIMLVESFILSHGNQHPLQQLQ